MEGKGEQKEKIKYVEDLAGFDFIKINDNEAAFRSLDGIFICEVPKEGERWKHQEVIREATTKEMVEYNKKLEPIEKSRKENMMGEVE
jgi:hypothetical protein